MVHSKQELGPGQIFEVDSQWLCSGFLAGPFSTDRLFDHGFKT